MRKGLIRRVVGRKRGSRSARGGSGSVITDASGKRYRVVAVNEDEAAEFADPPRRWGRVGIMAGGWAAVLLLGASVAPGFAASGSQQNEDARDEPASSASNAAWRYLRYGSNEDLDRATAALCENAAPEVAPSDLEDIRRSYAETLGGIARVDVETEDPVPMAEGSSITGRVSYIYQGSQRHEDFVITVLESDGAFCVSDATQVQVEEPGSGDGTGDAADPQTLATDFLRAIVVERDPAAASALQCTSFTGATPQDLDAAIDEWAALNGTVTAFINSIDPADSTESSTTSFEAEVSLQGDLSQEMFSFVVGVQKDCIATLEDRDGLA